MTKTPQCSDCRFRMANWVDKHGRSSYVCRNPEIIKAFGMGCTTTQARATPGDDLGCGMEGLLFEPKGGFRRFLYGIERTFKSIGNALNAAIVRFYFVGWR